MYLKSLSLKGFKSFADPTTLDLEPGVTVVVGPNGSGKSNVVDAIAWVLGAQGPRVVRSAKMDDVIFAGTDKRAALGRAEVSLTIDNASRRLPIEFNEVTITRTLFRSGESEYALNGAPCRLLDVQELLYDSGVGRQQHVIIGQGQLDVVLAQRPEDRRMIIEEAAGILKYRRRRERAERRLEASEAALARLSDLLREVRRQIRPLERQAASAIRSAALRAELDALRLYLAGQELAALEARRAAVEDESGRGERTREELGAELASLERALVSGAQRLESARAEDLVYLLGRAERLTERSEGLAAVIGERRRARTELLALLADTEAPGTAENELARTSAELAALEDELEALRQRATELHAAATELELAIAEHEAAFGDLETETPVELGEVRGEHSRAREAQSRAGEEAARAGEKVAGLLRESAELERHLAETSEVHAAATAALEASRTELARLREREADANARRETAADALAKMSARRHQLGARREALELALAETRAGAGLEHLAGVPGLLGTALDILAVRDELVSAVSAALEGLLDVVVFAETADARAALARLRERAGSGAVLALESLATTPRSHIEGAAGLALLAAELGGEPSGAGARLLELLGDVLLCREGFEAALGYASRYPQRTIVTLEGDRFSPTSWRVGPRQRGASKAALDETTEQLASTVARLAALETDDRAFSEALATARFERESHERALAVADSDLAHLGDELARTTEALGVLEERTRAARLAQSDASGRLGELSGALATIEGRLFALEEIGQAQLERSSARLASAGALEDRRSRQRSAEHELELRIAALEARRLLLTEREASLRAGIERRQRELDQARATEERVDEAAALEDAQRRLGALRTRLFELRGGLARVRDRREQAARAIQAELEALRERRSALEQALGEGRERRQQLEIELTEVRIRRESALETLGREFGVGAATALGAARPELAEGVEPASRAAALEAELISLGPVNPLAHEELTALTERHGFLEAQLEDVRGARRELNQIIHAVDAEIVDVFSAAFADVEAHFAALFETLFPGGNGRLVLSSPDELLTSGVDIEARPAGRNVRRLSLLSGGERSLVALAFLFAVFRSRPSPFYVLDEVEAALDEMNLRRFLALLDEFRDEAQLIVVSHQKKTMETADALYGVTMQAGGASRVVSERVARADLRRFELPIS